MVVALESVAPATPIAVAKMATTNPIASTIDFLDLNRMILASYFVDSFWPRSQWTTTFHVAKGPKVAACEFGIGITSLHKQKKTVFDRFHYRLPTTQVTI
jgi:hypothetical protein